MWIFKLNKSKNWHITINERFSICHNANIYKKFSDVDIDKEYVSIVYDKSDFAQNIKEDLCKPCLMKAYEDGLIEVEFVKIKPIGGLAEK